jgi:hypothetical protein
MANQLSTGLKVALPRGIVMLNLGMRFSNKRGVRLNPRYNGPVHLHDYYYETGLTDPISAARLILSVSSRGWAHTLEDQSCTP